MIKKSRNILLVLIIAVSFVAICGLTVFADEYTTIDITSNKTISNFGDVKDGVVLNLHGHTLKVDGQASCQIAYLEINGDGGTIDFCNTNHSKPIFYFEKGSDVKSDYAIKVNNVTIKNIKAPNLFHMGHINYSQNYYWIINNVNFVDGTFTHDGGVCYMDADTFSSFSFNNCNFVNLTCQGDAAALYINRSGVEKHVVGLNGTSFVNCKSDGAGGAICCNLDKVTLGSTSANVNDKTVFYNCHSYNGGGAIRSYGEKTIVQNAMFAENSTDATYYGGGAIMLDDDYCKVNNCTFFYNHADGGYGGALYMNDSDDEIHDCLFSNNSAYKGCGSHIYYPPKTVTGCKVYNYSSSESFCSGYSVSDTANKLDTSWVVPLADVNYDSSGKLKNGSQESPILLRNAEELAALAADISADRNTYDNKHYKLESDVSNAFVRIANFNGEINFDGHTIRTKLTEKYFDGGSPKLCDPIVLNVLGENEGYLNAGTDIKYIDCSSGSSTTKSIRITQRIFGDCDTLDLRDENCLITGTANVSGRIKVSGNVNLIFASGTVLNANNGIELPNGSTLSLYSQSLNNKGKLNSICKDQLGAGIGGNYAAEKKVYQIDNTNHSCAAYLGTGMGTLDINAVDIVAKGNGGAGIGGGQGAEAKAISTSATEFPGMGGDGGTLNIYNSEVQAVGQGGRDIGGGDGGKNIILKRFYCAGAGGGAGATINLFSGEIKAASNGIGGGNAGNDGTITCGQYYCPSHHSSLVYEGGNGGNLNINGGQVYANTIRGGYGSPTVTQDEGGIRYWSGAKGGAATVLNIADGLYVRIGTKVDNLGPAELAIADNLKDVASKFCFIGPHTHKYKTVYKWTEKHTVCRAYKICEKCGYETGGKIAKKIEYRVIQGKNEGEVKTEYTAIFEEGEDTIEVKDEVDGEPEMPQNDMPEQEENQGNLASIFSSGSIWIVLGIAALALIGILALVLVKLRKTEN